MTLDELTQKACDVYEVTYEAFGPPGTEHSDAMRVAVLAVLAEVRAMVPEPVATRPYSEHAGGWNDAVAEMLRRLDAMGAPK